MSSTNQFNLSLQSLADTRNDLHQVRYPMLLIPKSSTLVAPGRSPVDLPAGSILLGLAEDGLPILLDLYDPAAGPILVAGDGGSGKTVLLSSLARFTDHPDPGDIQFAVVTPFPEEWTLLEASPHSMGIWPADHPSAQAFLSQLVCWAKALPETRQAILLLIDGLDRLTGSNLQFQNTLRWLLLNGPKCQVYPVVTINPARLSHCKSWLAYFSTWVIGQVKHLENYSLLPMDPQVDLAGLLPGAQFLLSQPGKTIKFWLPPLC